MNKIHAYLHESEKIHRDGRQESCLRWAREAFAQTDAAEVGPETRVLRFLEEALELVQAQGITPEKASHLLSVVYARPVGEVSQEIGGVMVTLMCYAEAVGLSIAGCELTEIKRINSKPVEHFQRRQQEKRENGL